VMVGASNATKIKIKIDYAFQTSHNRGWAMVDTRNVTKKYDSKCNNKHNNITKQKLLKEWW
jgi:hypothetical protein